MAAKNSSTPLVGIVEAGEDCDCGTTRNCLENDICCITKNTNKGTPCKTNHAAGYECHPSQGPCCLKTCMFRNITHLGVVSDTNAHFYTILFKQFSMSSLCRTVPI